MPRKPQFSAEKIIDTAFRLTREQGRQGLSAPAIAEALQCSTMPIYSHFKNMEDLDDAVMDRAWQLMFSYLESEKNDDPWVAHAIAYIRFAEEEKHLFRCMLDGKYPERQKERITQLGNFSNQLLQDYEKFDDVPAKNRRAIRFVRFMLSHGLAISANLNWGLIESPQKRNKLLTAVSHALINGLQDLECEED